MKTLLSFLILVLVSTAFSAKHEGQTGNISDDVFKPLDEVEIRSCAVRSTSAAFVECAQLEPAPNSIWRVHAECVGLRSDNAEFDTFEKTAFYKRAGGSTELQGAVVAGFNQPGTSGWDIQFSIMGTKIDLEVSSPLETVDWRCKLGVVRLKG